MGSKKRSRSSKIKSEKTEEDDVDRGEEEERGTTPPTAVADGDNIDNNVNVNDASGSSSSPPPDDRASRRAARRAERLEDEKRLLSKIPTHDDDGMPYGKIQIRRMKRRVKHGLSPIPTEEEEREIRERERLERLEEEELYYEVPPTVRGKDGEDDEDEDDDGDGDEDGDGGRRTSGGVNDDDVSDEEGPDASSSNDDNGDVDEEEGGGREDDTAHDDVADAKRANAISRPPPMAKKSKRNKPVPPDYVCQACQNNSSSADGYSPHWIYDCPLKTTKRGCNAIAKKLRGLHDPPSRKVFVGGLPFDCDEGMVKRFFDGGLSSSSSSSSSSLGDGVVHVKLLKFEDSKRCKGQAFLTFDTDEGAAMAITKMNGSTWMEIPEPGTSTKGNKKKEGDDARGSKRELRLKVTRALNRFVTSGVAKKTNTTGGGRGGHENALKRIKRKSTE